MPILYHPAIRRPVNPVPAIFGATTAYAWIAVLVLAMDSELEPVFQKRLQHGPEHHCRCLRSFRLCVDGISGSDPTRATANPLFPHWNRHPSLPIRVHNVGLLDDVVEGQAVDSDSSRIYFNWPYCSAPKTAIIKCALARLDGRY